MARRDKAMKRNEANAKACSISSTVKKNLKNRNSFVIIKKNRVFFFLNIPNARKISVELIKFSRVVAFIDTIAICKQKK